jgi:hypothetical protein
VKLNREPESPEQVDLAVIGAERDAQPRRRRRQLEVDVERLLRLHVEELEARDRRQTITSTTMAPTTVWVSPAARWNGPVVVKTEATIRRVRLSNQPVPATGSPG